MPHSDAATPPAGRGGPLAGIRVVDLTTARSGPTCVRQLVDLGAEAVQVVGPGWNALHGSDGWNLHRGKRSIELDLRSPEGLATFERLVATADVLVENYRPAVKHRLGIGPDVLLARHPRLVYASISGFGQDGPYADRPGVDQIAQGLGGLMSVTGPPGSGPWRVGIAITDTVAGTFLAQAVTAALYARERTGVGQWVHTSLLETMVNIMDFQAARWLNEGEEPGQTGNDHPTLSPMGTFRTADGWVNVAPFGRFDGFCAAIGAPALAEDPRFQRAPDRVRNRRELSEAIEAALAAATTSEWVARLNAADVPAGPVLDVEQCFADEQVRHLAMTIPVAHPAHPDEQVTVLRHPVTFTGTPAPAPGRPPRPGEHTADVVAELDALSPPA